MIVPQYAVHNGVKTNHFNIIFTHIGIGVDVHFVLVCIIPEDNCLSDFYHI